RLRDEQVFEALLALLNAALVENAPAVSGSEADAARSGAKPVRKARAAPNPAKDGTAHGKDLAVEPADANPPTPHRTRRRTPAGNGTTGRPAANARRHPRSGSDPRSGTPESGL